jgi:hypothetical protein
LVQQLGLAVVVVLDNILVLVPLLQVGVVL